MNDDSQWRDGAEKGYELGYTAALDAVIGLLSGEHDKYASAVGCVSEPGEQEDGICGLCWGIQVVRDHWGWQDTTNTDLDA